MFGYNINSLKSEIDGFKKLIKTFNKKSKSNKKAKAELNIIEEKLYSKIDNLLIVNSSEINNTKKNRELNILLRQKARLAKYVISYDNSFLNLKNFLSCKFSLFKSTLKLLFHERNFIISLIVSLLFLFPFLLFSTILAIINFLIRKKSKSRKSKRKLNLNSLKGNDLDDKIFDIVDRYAKNREEIKAIIELIKGKISPFELEETLKKLKGDPFFKDLINDLDYPKFLKELNNLLEKQINEFKYNEPELYLTLKDKDKEKSGLLTQLKDTISDKIVNKIKRNRKALKTLLSGDINKVNTKIKKFKDKRKKLFVDLETLDNLSQVRKKIKVKKLMKKNKNFNKSIENYKIHGKKFKKNKLKFNGINEIIELNSRVEEFDRKFDKYFEKKGKDLYKFNKKIKAKKEKFEKDREKRINNFKNAINSISPQSIGGFFR